MIRCLGTKDQRFYIKNKLWGVGKWINGRPHHQDKKTNYKIYRLLLECLCWRPCVDSTDFNSTKGASYKASFWRGRRIPILKVSFPTLKLSVSSPTLATRRTLQASNHLLHLLSSFSIFSCFHWICPAVPSNVILPHMAPCHLLQAS